MKLTANQLRAIHAKGDVESKGTLPIKIVRPGYDIERLAGTDEIIVRKRGESTGIITTRDNLSRAIKNIEQKEKMEKLMKKKTGVLKKYQQLTDAQLRQLGQMQREAISVG